ncbi:MAG: hypothetical protein H6813_06580 [Phycisphaeraceae bacterium]|nr:hypothetical protein [Phycisphaeraceae bacterium]MCB9848138.1 hypothetical protein [Phycisphaeraceae bacterium]
MNPTDAEATARILSDMKVDLLRQTTITRGPTPVYTERLLALSRRELIPGELFSKIYH